MMSEIQEKITLPFWDPKCPSLKPTIVCYADILGYQALMERAHKSGKETEFLKRIKNSLHGAYSMVRNAQTHGGKVEPVFDMKVFTDNIVVAYPLSPPDYKLGEDALGTLLTLFGQVQAKLAGDGFLLRGGIAVGDHYQDRDMAYGRALIEAVSLDTPQGAPRLVLGSSVEPLVSKHLSFYGDHDWAPPYQQMLEDPRDEKLFINYLGSAFAEFPDGPFDCELLASHGEFVRESLNTYRLDQSVRAKYEWMAVYHNSVCQAFADRYSDKGGWDADDQNVAQVTNAQRALEYLLPCEGLRPRPIDAQRLRERIAGSQDSSDVS